jgi:hypothetical protein
MTADGANEERQGKRDLWRPAAFPESPGKETGEVKGNGKHLFSKERGLLKEEHWYIVITYRRFE